MDLISKVQTMDEAVMFHSNTLGKGRNSSLQPVLRYTHLGKTTGLGERKSLNSKPDCVELVSTLLKNLLAIKLHHHHRHNITVALCSLGHTTFTYIYIYIHIYIYIYILDASKLSLIIHFHENHKRYREHNNTSR